MKTISGRAFRVAFPTLTEPVIVSTRGEGGEYRTLGTWTPMGAKIAYTDTWATGGNERPFTPVPKPRRGTK